jgi:hypothetical protein
MDNQQPSETSTWHYISLETIVDHYARMALNPASIDHARYRVRELEKDETGLWVGLGKEVAKRIKELKDADLRN